MLHPQQKGAYRTLPMYWVTRALALGVLSSFLGRVPCILTPGYSNPLPAPKKNKKLMEPE